VVSFVFRSFLPWRGLHAIVLLLLTFALPMAAQATSYTFTEGSYNQGFGVYDPRRNSDWHNELNWEPQGIPRRGRQRDSPQQERFCASAGYREATHN
jgi:hypothetical protein